MNHVRAGLTRPLPGSPAASANLPALRTLPFLTGATEVARGPPRRGTPSAPLNATQNLQGGITMLVLTRRVGETIVIDDTIAVTVLSVEGHRVRLGITAPPAVTGAPLS